MPIQYDQGMRVRVELRRERGEWIARFRPQTGYTGTLALKHKVVDERQVQYLTVHCEPRQGYPGERLPGPELFDPRLIGVTDDQLRFAGIELVERAWHAQQWDCFVL